MKDFYCGERFTLRKPLSFGNGATRETAFLSAGGLCEVYSVGRHDGLLYLTGVGVSASCIGAIRRVDAPAYLERCNRSTYRGSK